MHRLGISCNLEHSIHGPEQVSNLGNGHQEVCTRPRGGIIQPAGEALQQIQAVLTTLRPLEARRRAVCVCDGCGGQAQPGQEPANQSRGSFEELPTPDGRTLSVPRMPGSLAGMG
jgi:hypothetical protein